MPKKTLKIEYAKTAALIPYISNARTHTEEQVKQIAASIKEFGFTNPVLVDDESGIIAGHGRISAAELLGMEIVPTINLGHLTDAQRRAYIIADNKLALNAGWDFELLAVELVALEELDFERDILGFTANELELILDGWDSDVTIPEETPDQDRFVIRVIGNKQDEGAIRDILETALSDMENVNITNG